MPFLPVVDRELRVAARDPKLWWRRGLLTLAALVIFLFVLIAFGSVLRPGDLGNRLFVALGGVAMVYALAAGPLTAADSISSERRGGTLGLLFLTDLRSADIVAGKTAALATDHLFVVLAALPVLAISFLVGGIGLVQFSLFALSLLNLLFLSLCLSLCVSALATSSRVAFLGSFGLMLALTIGYIACGEALRVPSSRDSWFYTFCPSYSIYLAFDKPGSLAFWQNLAGVHLLAWAGFALGTRRTSCAWRVGTDASVERPVRRFHEWNRGTVWQRKAWRHRMLEVQPITWLGGRNRLQMKLPWFIVWAATGYWFIRFLNAPTGWPDDEAMVLWPMFSHYVFCVWLANEAPGRLADDKQSGALELLLCTPLRPQDILKGAKAGLWRVFGRILLFLWLFYAFNVAAVLLRHRGSNFGDEVMTLALWGALVVPLQARALVNVGLYEGLRSGNSFRATVVTLVKVVVLPMVLFVICMLSLQIGRLAPSIGAQVVFSLWGLAHVTVSLIYSSYAERQLRHRFRTLAGSAQTKPWWHLFTKEKPVVSTVRMGGVAPRSVAR